MIRLEKKDYNKITNLVDELKYNKALICAVIEGSAEGTIYVDNVDSPQNAYIENEFAFIIGSGSNSKFNDELLRYIFDEKIPLSKEKEVVLFMQTDNKDCIESMFKEKGCITIWRKMFRFDLSAYKKGCDIEPLPNGLEILPIDEKFAKKYSKHNDMVRNNKFGFCLVDGTNVLSECSSVAVGANEAEISIETDEKHRRCGLAFRVARKFIDHCIELGIMPIWSCWPFRKESIALANKLGFSELEDIPVIYWAEDM